MKKFFIFATLMIATLVFSSCKSVNSVDKMDTENEELIVFTRPSDYSIFFTNSMRQFIKITHENAITNSADKLNVAVGIRYVGYNKWYNWYIKSPKSIILMGQVKFYDNSSELLYTSNKQYITINLGDTVDFSVLCPVSGAKSYQVILSETLD